MSDLDKKLVKHFVETMAKNGQGYGYDKADVEEYANTVKQAFIDDGWVKPINLNREGAWDITKDPVYRTPVLMTGQEWFDKFFKELGELDGEIAYTTKNGGFYSDVYGVWGKSIEEAAKKASGIEQ